MKPVYLDYNATTPVAPEVVDPMLPYLREHFGNASSAHAYGGVAHDALERARHVIGRLIGAAPSSIIFTANGTESNNLAIEGVWRAERAKGGVRKHVIVSAVEPRRSSRLRAGSNHKGLASASCRSMRTVESTARISNAKLDRTRYSSA